MQRKVVCFRRPDCGDSARKREQEKHRGGGVGSEGEVRSSLPLSGFLLFFSFSRSLTQRRTPLSERLE